MELNLLEKTELWIENLKLNNANLNEIAQVVSQTLMLPREKVLVVDVRETHITLDILQRYIHAEQFFGKKRQLLAALSQVSGVEIFPETDIHSDGILGSIALNDEEAVRAIDNTQRMRDEIMINLQKRVKVFPTGFEVKRGMIEDTNTPLISSTMEAAGYKVNTGDSLDDDETLISGMLRKAVYEGYGIIITTGGIGAEDKDKTVEAVLKIDPDAATPYIVKFEKGKGRHKKEGVRIAVGQSGNALIVSLPGPNDEVKLCLEVLLPELEKDVSKERLASKLADVLRHKLGHKFKHEMHH
ncbi:competence/damage-inducible protein A [Metallumcola ferriviriculae]|uniref:Competence/damage-inducible protein A n=1 Tax=Metallumcola ferriviriculae TaxID=3039180 RepID=A0AAU0UMU8_9FIRM|nr:competence/damage-inducible protein A [Desulfitibacteraceae bacterium MK1]